MHVHVEHGPPRTWQQFEELCGDTFSALWSDPGLVRHGRGGQAQDGVDSYGKQGTRWPVGLQCKRKSKWPVTRLTTAEIDKEVAAALKFRPKLRSFYILTTAPEDAKLLKHVREITVKHKRKRLFEVHLLGWQEIYARATRYPEVADKHFGASGSGLTKPLLDKWYASDHRLELKGTKLRVACRELAHEFKEWPAGRLMLRQRESDALAARIAAYNGRTLSLSQRKARLLLRDKLARLQEQEAWISRGLRLLFGDPTIATWMFEVYKETGDAPLAAAGWVNHELDPNRIIVQHGTVRMRLISPKNTGIQLSHYISQKQVSLILELRAERDERFGPGRHTETVDELPENVRGGEAIPAVIHAILRQVDDGRSLEELRKAGVLEIGSWRFELG
jgi:hypothetical protein